MGCSNSENKIDCNDKLTLKSSQGQIKKNSHVKKINIKVNHSKEVQEKCGDLTLNSIYKYDERGNLIEKSEQGKVKFISFYEYNSSGKLISRVIQDSPGNISQTDLYTYDSRGNKISDFSKDHDKNNEYLNGYIYDNSNNLIQETEISYRNNKKYGGKISTKYKYDDDDNKIEETRYYDGDIMSKLTYDYNNHGDINKISKYDENGLLEFNKIKMYDNQERQVLDSTTNMGENYESFGLSNSFRLTYDKKGNIIEDKNINITSGIEYKKSFTYDEIGNKVEEISKNNRKDKYNYISSSKYIYDKNGNWTFQTYYKNGIPLYEVNREIEYYDKNVNQKKNISTNDNVFDYDENRRLYVNNKYSFSVKVPLFWEHDYGVSNNNIFRTFEKDSSFVVNIVVDKNKNYTKINSHSYLDSYGEEKLKREVLNGLKNQGLNINPKSIKIRKSYLKNVESIKLEYTFKEYYDDFSFDISMLQHVFFRGENKITLSCSSPSVFLDANLTSFDYLTSLFHHLPIN